MQCHSKLLLKFVTGVLFYDEVYIMNKGEYNTIILPAEENENAMLMKRNLSYQIQWNDAGSEKTSRSSSTTKSLERAVSISRF